MKLIGDPHLGREFKANVPLDRRGEREAMMFEQFQKELDSKEGLIVIVGDLFEHWFISYEHLYTTIDILVNWKPRNPIQKLVILQGNHDYSPAEGVYGAFDILDLALRYHPHIAVVRSPQRLYGVVFFPWEWNKTALEQVEEFDDWDGARIAVGHWDLESWGDNTSHLCPAQALRERGITDVYSGHWHIAGVYDVDGVQVNCTGSMQPMTHAEDPDGKLYVTLTEEEYTRTDPETLRNKYVRVIVSDDANVDAPESCLGFKIQKKPSDVVQRSETVNLGEFDLHKILTETLKKHEVPDPIQGRIKGRLNDIA